MAASGRPRRDLLVRFALDGPEPRVDVGADHGFVAADIGAIASERQIVRGRPLGLDWVTADGLDCFRDLGTAVIAGMGYRSIGRILERGPRVERAVLHAQDDPCALRVWLAANGWRIVQEGLAPEARRFAEVVVAVPGHEAHTGLELEYGPVLLHDGDPWLLTHLAQLEGHLARLVEQTRPVRSVWEGHVARLEFVRRQRARLDPALDG
ncbi:MAG: tRNA (adenine(22)-N(1))-methyltransferase TrmK [Myxococcota bacterium]